jgi:AhpD family alkylhydroperoxidase
MNIQTATNEGIEAPRLDLAAIATRQIAAMRRLEGSIELDEGLRHLVKMRASQINGCGYCIDMHWKEARAAGESEERGYMLGAWRESPLYDARERAALALTEAVTRLDDGHVPGAVWAAAAERFDAGELANLLFQITSINAWNRLMIASRAEPGHYQVGEH